MFGGEPGLLVPCSIVYNCSSVPVIQFDISSGDFFTGAISWQALIAIFSLNVLWLWIMDLCLMDLDIFFY